MSVNFSQIPEVLDELRAGKMIILVDDEDRENEGDLVCAAEKVTPQIINFMAKFGRGLICLPLTGEKCDALALHPQVQDNTARLHTAFTVSIDAAEGITTGISAADRRIPYRRRLPTIRGPQILPGRGIFFRFGRVRAGFWFARGRPKVRLT